MEKNHNYDDSKFYNLNNRKKIIIFLATSFFAIHTLIFILMFRLNFPYGDDGQAFSFAYEYLATGSLDGLFGITAISAYASHLIYSVKLLALPNLIFNSFDVVNYYYLQFVIMSLTVLFLFLILKKTNKRLYWVIIPISAFIYCPIYNTGYFIFSSLMWLLVTLCVVLTVFLLNREKITHSIFLSAISIAVFSTFLNLIGIVAWLAGFISLLKKDGKRKIIKKKYLAAWIFATLVVGLIFLSLTKSSLETYWEQFFSIEGLSFVTTYLATSYRFGTENIVYSKIIGIITLILSGYLFYYFIRIKKNVQESYPWLLLILISIISGIIIAIGRMEGHDGNESFYKAVSQFSQIGILVLVSMLMLEIKKNRPKKFANIKLCICIVIIVSQMVFLVPSYYASWVKGEHYYEVKTAYVDCYSLTHGTECLKAPEFSGTLEPPFELNRMYITNFWLENKLSIFGEESFNQQNRDDLKYFEDVLKKNPNYELGVGEIQKVNDRIVLEDTVVMKEEFIKIEGWMLDKDRNQLDSLFVIIDDIPFLKYDDFVYMDSKEYSVNETKNNNSKWIITFLSGYLELGCHDISFVGLHNETLFHLDQKIILCKEPNEV
tara:strand:+ start:96 stop:1907 length:1812 start_codon:yes stop_codon:yes gene_type:complete